MQQRHERTSYLPGLERAGPAQGGPQLAFLAKGPSNTEIHHPSSVRSREVR